MLSLADPYLTIHDPDTDWQYNPAYLLDASNQAYLEYIFGFGKRKEYYAGRRPTYFFEGKLKENAQHKFEEELGAIFSLGKAKLGFFSESSQLKYKLSGQYFREGRLYTQDLEYPKENDKDISLKTVYALPLDNQTSLGISLSIDKIKNIQNFRSEFVTFAEIEDLQFIEDYRFFDTNFGLCLKKEKLKIGLSLGGGVYTGDDKYTYSQLISGLGEAGEGDFKGEKIHLLGHLEYKINERLKIPLVLEGSYDKKEREYDISGYWGPYKEIDHFPRGDVILKTGLNFLIDKDFLVATELYYNYAKYEDRYEYIDPTPAYDCYEFDTQKNTLGIKASLEKKIFRNLIGRMGGYYSYSFYKLNYNYTSIPPSSSNYNGSGDAWQQRLGLGLGISYVPKDNFKFELGSEIVFINKYSRDIEGFHRNGSIYSRERDIEDILHRFGLRFTYLF